MTHSSEQTRRGQGTYVWKARPTTYRGIPMRSRLEAEWAQHFDEEAYRAFGARWKYEPMCFAGVGGQYLPDFELERNGYPTGRLFIEVKSTVEAGVDLYMRHRMAVIWESVPHVGLVIACGHPDNARFFGSHGDAWGELLLPHEQAI